MEVSKSKLGGSLQISTDAIAKIAKLATLEINGVEAVECNQTGFTGKLFSVVKIQAPITVELVDSIAEITVNVKVKYGSKIPSLAEKIQDNVKSSVQNMTNITVSKVNVVISGVVLEEKQTEAK